jgi:hypothetical protein
MIADMRNVIGPLTAQLKAVVEENGRQVLAGAEMRCAKEQPAAEVG